ncbi:hypothetical protein RRF57_000809 [Xylaria bambusicola]|uniref:Carbohydrate kinase PfkB domain-containing protein n=1 Tax=Xylaria bambusicola TaxID=326684 RepID=A0AAN7UAT9_9PEZI
MKDACNSVPQSGNMGQEVSSVVEDPENDRLCFLSLAPVSIDDINYLYPKTPTDVPFRTLRCSIPGGAGLWGTSPPQFFLCFEYSHNSPSNLATFGARLFKSRECSEEVGCYIAVGTGFIQSALEKIQSWNMTTSIFRVQQPSNRVFLRYEDEEWTKYLRRKGELPDPGVTRLVDTEYLGAKCFHFLADPESFTESVYSLDGMRGLSRFHGEDRLIIWEPSHTAASGDIMEYTYAMSRADVFSPNHTELLAITAPGRKSAKFRYRSIEEGARTCINRGIGPNRSGIIVVRCGQYGCFYMNRKKEKGWVRPYYSHRHPKMEDVTGSGSAFLGAFGVAYLETGDMKKACVRGAVAASYALEQFGLPVLDNPDKPRGGSIIDEPKNEPSNTSSAGEIKNEPGSGIPNYGTFNNKPKNESSMAEASSSKKDPASDKPKTGSSSKNPGNESSGAEASSSKANPGSNRPKRGSSRKKPVNPLKSKFSKCCFRSKGGDGAEIIVGPELWNGEDPLQRLALLESNPDIYTDPRDDDAEASEGLAFSTDEDSSAGEEREENALNRCSSRDSLAPVVRDFAAPVTLMDFIDESNEESQEHQQRLRKKKGKAPVISINF